MGVSKTMTVVRENAYGDSVSYIEAKQWTNLVFNEWYLQITHDSRADAIEVLLAITVWCTRRIQCGLLFVCTDNKRKWKLDRSALQTSDENISINFKGRFGRISSRNLRSFDLGWNNKRKLQWRNTRYMPLIPKCDLNNYFIHHCVASWPV